MKLSSLSPDLICSQTQYPICMVMQFIGVCRNTVLMLMETGQLKYGMKRRGRHQMVKVVRGSEILRYIKSEDELKFY